MKIWSQLDGTLIRALKTQAEIDLYGIPDAYDYELELDADANPEVVEHIHQHWNDLLLVGSTLTHLGVEVTINPPGAAWIERLREEAAETTVANIPNWATWTETEALAWFDANVTDAATAIQVERALVRIVLAMRNKLWPNLEGS